VPDYVEPSLGLAHGIMASVPSLDDAMPSFEANDVDARQPYHICFIGEKSSLGDVLLPIARRIGLRAVGLRDDGCIILGTHRSRTVCNKDCQTDRDNRNGAECEVADGRKCHGSGSRMVDRSAS
jgi:hypothetical protein